jgi:hypothetical protein
MSPEEGGRKEEGMQEGSVGRWEGGDGKNDSESKKCRLTGVNTKRESIKRGMDGNRE